MFSTSTNFAFRLSCLAVAAAPSLLTALPTIEEPKKSPSSVSYDYQVIDLGKTDIETEKLSTYALPLSYAPNINNSRQVFFNTSEEGFIKDPACGEIAPQISSMRSHCFGINESGDLLLCFYRTPSDVEWQVWTLKKLRKEKSNRIDTDCLPTKNLFLRAINKSKTAVGSFIPEGRLRPVIWTPEEGLHHLGYYLGWDIAGIAWGVNGQGAVFGSLDNGDDNPPFVWTRCGGLEVLKNYRYSCEVQLCKDFNGPISFSDMVLSEQGSVYGTFTVSEPSDEDPEPFHYAYRWEPGSNTIQVIDIKGMRISAINSENTLAGSLRGKAAIRDQGRSPVAIDELVGKDGAQGWEFIEATGINDHGDIVGWGSRHGQTHLFLLKRASLKKCSPLNVRS